MWRLLSLLFLLLSACSQSNLAVIPLKATGEEEIIVGVEDDNDIKVAFAALVSPQETRAKYDLLIKYMEEHLQRPITIIQKQTYEEVSKLLKNGEVDLGFICSVPYVIGIDEGYLEDVATTVIAEKDVYRSYIITHKNSGLDTFEDLKGKRFAFSDPYSYTGRLASLVMLNERGYTASEFFGETFYTYSHDYTISAVVRGTVDAATINSIFFDMLLDLENEDAMQIQIVEKGPWMGSPPVVVSNKTDPELKKEIKKLMLSLNDDRQGRNILRELQIEKYVPINRDNYQPIRNVLHLIGGE